ncbi:MAG: TapB family protein [Leptospirales bacterium]
MKKILSIRTILLLSFFAGGMAGPFPAVASAGAALDYLPLVPMEKTFDGLGGKIHVQETLRPLPGVGTAKVLEVTRKIAYLNFPTRTIVSVYRFEPATGTFTKNSSTSAFSHAVFAYHPPLVRVRLPFRKGESWDGEDGENRIHDRVWGKVRITLPAGSFVCWVVRRRLSYNLISRRSTQILYEYYAKGVGFVGEGGWSATGKWHWSRRLLSFKMGTEGSPPPAPRTSP